MGRLNSRHHERMVRCSRSGLAGRFRRKRGSESARTFQSGGHAKVYWHWFKNVENDSVDMLGKSLPTSPKNLGHFLDTLEVAPKANTA
jgi:hypothetical protein